MKIDVAEIDFFRTYLKGANLHIHILVLSEDPLLVSIRSEFHRVDPERNASAAFWAGHSIDAVSVPAIPGFQKHSEYLIAEDSEEGLPIDCRIIQTIGALNRGIKEIPVQSFHNVIGSHIPVVVVFGHIYYFTLFGLCFTTRIVQFSPSILHSFDV